MLRYAPSLTSGRNPQLIRACLYLYWTIGLFQRHRPFIERSFRESALIGNGHRASSLLYEEGFLRESDCRFVLHWIAPFQDPEHVPLNYCAVEGGSYRATEQLWHLHLKDTFGGREAYTKAKCVINCAGVWADHVNQEFGIQTPYKHVMSKGVYIGLGRQVEHQVPLIFEMEQEGDVITFLPWGPIALWGPTETMVDSIHAGYSVSEEDVRFLLDQAHRHLRHAVTKEDIVSLRCGVRPLVVRQSFHRECYPLDISRMHKIVTDDERPWISLYGGKMTGCVETARKISAEISRWVSRRNAPIAPCTDEVQMELMSFPGLNEKVPSVKWCMDNELCVTLQDYLRRRTNISQWVAREGLGHNDEHLAAVEHIALTLNRDDQAKAHASVAQYREQVATRFDSVIAHV
jgi:glycerol-3-phosphate dehydrogenase